MTLKITILRCSRRFIILISLWCNVMLLYVPRYMNLGRGSINTRVCWYASSWCYDARLYTTCCPKYTQEYCTLDHMYSLQIQISQASTGTNGLQEIEELISLPDNTLASKSNLSQIHQILVSTQIQKTAPMSWIFPILLVRTMYRIFGALEQSHNVL